MSPLYPAVANKVPNRVPYIVVANLYPTKYSLPPCEEKYCVAIPMKIWKSDSVVEYCVFSPTIE